MAEYKNFINGKFVPAKSGKTYENRNPADRDDLIGHFADSAREDVEKAVALRAREVGRRAEQGLPGPFELEAGVLQDADELPRSGRMEEAPRLRAGMEMAAPGAVLVDEACDERPAAPEDPGRFLQESLEVVDELEDEHDQDEVKARGLERQGFAETPDDMDPPALGQAEHARGRIEPEANTEWLGEPPRSNADLEPPPPPGHGRFQGGQLGPVEGRMGVVPGVVILPGLLEVSGDLPGSHQRRQGQ